MNREEMMNKVVNATDGWLVKNAIWSNKVVDLIEFEIAAAEKRGYHKGYTDAMGFCTSHIKGDVK